ncbi:circularly permutated Ras protein 1 isoform X2 [Clupea harengus]|nr:circularly permutated Ras protein 1 isoform X2 [Clupea harengus]
MEFACSHIVCNWTSGTMVTGLSSSLPGATSDPTTCPPLPRPRSVCDHDYDNRISVIPKAARALVPPPVPPRHFDSPAPKQPHATSDPPPVPPRGMEGSGESPIKANVNVLLINVGQLVDISKASGIQSNQKPVYCERCRAVMSAVSNSQNRQNTNGVWCCEFCGTENHLSGPGMLSRHPHLLLQRPCPGRDVLYVNEELDADYENLEDMLVVFCVDVSGSMSVTSEIAPGNAMRSPTYVSRLQGVQDALHKALSSLLQKSPHRRVALVTFNDEVTVYGDGTAVPVTVKDWALLDYDHLRERGETHSTPHCIAESLPSLTKRVKELREHGATALGPAALVSVAMASQYPGSKVIICTDGCANIGLGQLEQEQSHSPAPSPYFYSQLANYATEKGVIVSVMTFEGEDCRLAEVGRLADLTGGRVNIVNIGTVATEIQSALADNIMATGVMATLLAPDGVYFPFEDDEAHKLLREIGNVTEGFEITFQFAVKPDQVESFQRRDRIPFQLQLDFRTRDLQKVTRVITQQRRVTTSSWVWAGSLNMGVLGVHCAQLCARLTMEGRVLEAQNQLRAQQDLLKDISKQRPSPREESVYGNWINTMSMICEDLTTDNKESRETKDLHDPPSSPVTDLSDEAAKVVYQMKRAKSVASTKRTAEASKS